MGKRGVMPITSSTLKNSEGRAMCRGQSLAGRQDESRLQERMSQWRAFPPLCVHFLDSSVFVLEINNSED